MKRSKKLRVSWPPGPKLCQVKMFRIEDCPAKVASQPQHHNGLKQSSRKPPEPDLPPGFGRNHYPERLTVSHIPQIKWKRPPKIIINDSLMVKAGGESTERKTENLRVAKVFEAIYPHRSAIPSRPSVSPVVEAERYDDSKTPSIRLTPIEDEWEESAEESSCIPLESSFTTDKQGQLEPRPPCSTQEPVSGLLPDLSLAASAALTALMKTKEQGSLVDPDLLIKLLSNPKMIKNLIHDTTTGKSPESENHPLNTNIKPTRLVSQHVTTSAIDRNPPQPIARTQEQSLTASQPYANLELRKVSPPRPGNGNISPMPINGNLLNIHVPVHSRVSELLVPARLPSSSLSMNFSLQRHQHGISEPKPQLQSNSLFNTSYMNNGQSSVGPGRDPQIGVETYPLNINRFDVCVRAKPVPMKNLDYFKNLIREHGAVNDSKIHETKQYYNSQTGISDGRVDNIKVEGSSKFQKKCIYFGSSRGCKLGESCMYVHDLSTRLRPNFVAEVPRAKRMKFSLKTG